jgi:hypothetical protein
VHISLSFYSYFKLSGAKVHLFHETAKHFMKYLFHPEKEGLKCGHGAGRQKQRRCFAKTSV